MATRKSPRCSECGEVLPPKGTMCTNCGCVAEFLSDILMREFGIDFELSLPRFRKPGWVFRGPSDHTCPGCGSRMSVARRFYTDSNGAPFWYWALICRPCVQVFAPKMLPKRTWKEIYHSSRNDQDPLSVKFRNRSTEPEEQNDSPPRPARSPEREQDPLQLAEWVQALIDLLAGKATTDAVALRFGVTPEVVGRWRQDAVSGISYAVIEGRGQTPREQALEQELGALKNAFAELAIQHELLKKSAGAPPHQLPEIQSARKD